MIPAGQLTAGSQVQSVKGDSNKVVSLLPRPGPAERVYNLGVNGEQVYYVGQSESLLVPNAYPHEIMAGSNLKPSQGLQKWTWKKWNDMRSR